MHHLSQLSLEGHLMHLCFVSWMSRPGKVLPSSRCVELNHIPTACKNPVNFEFQTFMSYLPRWITYCVNSGTRGLDPTHLVIIVCCVDLPGYLILFATHFSCPAHSPVGRLRHWCSLLISTHFTATPGIPPTLLHSRLTVSKAVSWLSSMDFTSDLPIRLRTFTPGKSGQRFIPLRIIKAAAGTQLAEPPLLPSLSSQRTEVTIRKTVIPHAGVAGSGFPIAQYPHCCLP